MLVLSATQFKIISVGESFMLVAYWGRLVVSIALDKNCIINTNFFYFLKELLTSRGKFHYSFLLKSKLSSPCGVEILKILKIEI